MILLLDHKQYADLQAFLLIYATNTQYQQS